MLRPGSTPSLLRLCLFALALALGAGTARAEPQASYEEAIRHAVEEYTLGHWAEAKVFFLRAHAVQPNARTLRGLGLTCYESRSYVEAIGYLRAALASPVQPLTDAMRENLAQLLQQSQQFVTHVVLDVYPARAALAVDQSAHALDGSRELLLDPGEHELSASAPGYKPVRRSVNATGGTLHVQLRLQPEARPQPSAAKEALASDDSGLAPYLLIGASGAAALAGGVLLAIAASDKAAVEGGTAGWSQLESRYDRGRTFFPVGFVLAGVGLCGVAAGLTWKLWPRGPEQAQLSLTPAGVALRGRL